MEAGVEMPGPAELFAGESIFVTGGSGFMGKVLLEKLLRSCPDVGPLYVLLRPKKGRGVEERLTDIVNAPLFEPLRKQNPSAVSKLRAVAGDCSELRLGISAADEALLAQEVSFVFHAAATVRFDDSLKSALLLNTRGTREVVEMAKKMKKLKALQYVSTTYCYTNQPVVQEKIYKAHLDWKTMVYLAEHEEISTLNALTHKLLDFQPNTYTLTKALAENVINDARHDIPVLIFRPAVVINSIQEPVPGWLDNLYGPFAIWAGVLKGVLRFSYGDPNVALSYTPVDWAIRGMILSTWAKSLNAPIGKDTDAMVVVNMEGSEYDRATYGEQMAEVHLYFPYIKNAIRYPRYHLGKNFTYYWLGVMVSHLPYGLLVDLILTIFRQKPRLMALYRKIYQVNDALAYFMCNEFPIETINIYDIEKMLPASSQREFTTLLSEKSSIAYNRTKFGENTIRGLSLYVLKEDVDVEKNKKHLKMLLLLEFVQYIVLFGLLYLMLGQTISRRLNLLGSSVGF